MITPRSAFVPLEDVTLHYLEWEPSLVRMKDRGEEQEQVEDIQESDDIPLVLLHGLGATAHTWSLVGELLCSHYQTIAFDLRGHGLSDQPEQGYDLVTIAEDVIRGMAALGLGQVAVVGHGWGARIAMVLAARHPALVSHLVLVDCPFVEPRHWPGMTRERFLREKAGKTTYASPESFLQMMNEEMAAFWTPEVQQIMLTYIRSLPDGSVEERLPPLQQRLIRESLWEERALPYYGKLACPVLLVPAAAQPYPGEEPPEKLENAEEFSAAKGQMVVQVARAIQRCTVFWMPETTHDIQLQRPQTLAKVITDFIKE